MTSMVFNFLLWDCNEWIMFKKILSCFSCQKWGCDLYTHATYTRINTVIWVSVKVRFCLGNRLRFTLLRVVLKVMVMKIIIDWYIFILYVQGSYDGTLRTNRWTVFQVFKLTIDFLKHINLLLVGSYQAEIIIIKHLIQERKNMIRVGVELDHAIRVVTKRLLLSSRLHCQQRLNFWWNKACQ